MYFKNQKPFSELCETKVKSIYIEYSRVKGIKDYYFFNDAQSVLRINEITRERDLYLEILRR